MQKIFFIIIPYITGFLEFIGIIVILIGGLKAVFSLIRNGFNLNDDQVKLSFAQSLELALEFKLASEILKTVIINTIDEIVILSVVVILRVIMTFVIRLEIKNISIKE